MRWRKAKANKDTHVLTDIANDFNCHLGTDHWAASDAALGLADARHMGIAHNHIRSGPGHQLPVWIATQEQMTLCAVCYCMLRKMCYNTRMQQKTA